MTAPLLDGVTTALQEAVGSLIAVAVRGALLFWGVYMARLLGTGLFDPPSLRKIAFVSMPLAVVVASFFAFYS